MSSQERARAALRNYLQQRRELGERELTLDGLDVDAVLRLVGAGDAGAADRASSGTANAATAAAGSADRPAAPAAEPPSPRKPAAIPEQRERENSVNAKVTGQDADADWRSALRAAGAAPGTRPPTEPERRKVGEVREPERPEPDRAEAGRPEPRAAQARAWSVPEASQLYDDSPGDAGKEELAVPPRKRAGKFAADASGSRSRTGSEPAATPVPLGDVPVGIEVGSGGSALYDRTIGSLRSIDAVAAAVQKCTRCPLYETATHGVPGEGNPDAGLVCVGEAPGANEDATGRPFVGQAGQLLTKILAAVNLSREDVFICNVLKHRPPGNRNPRPEEVEACSPYLLRQLELVKPRVIVAFGTFAAQTLLETKLPLGKLRGQIHRYHGIPLVVTYHPAALLRNSAWKRPTWEDVQLARRLLDRPGRS